MTQESDDTLDALRSDAERTAQNWHDRWHGQDISLGTCWCCCRACKHVNPHRDEAARAAVQDIEERIRESTLSPRPPDYRRRR